MRFYIHAGCSIRPDRNITWMQKVDRPSQLEKNKCFTLSSNGFSMETCQGYSKMLPNPTSEFWMWLLHNLAHNQNVFANLDTDKLYQHAFSTTVCIVLVNSLGRLTPYVWQIISLFWPDPLCFRSVFCISIVLYRQNISFHPYKLFSLYTFISIFSLYGTGITRYIKTTTFKLRK